jgi:hypothetical protein
MTKFEKAWKEFLALPDVNADALSQTTVADLVHTAQFEVDLHNEGQITLSPKQLKQFDRFIKRYSECAK